MVMRPDQSLLSIAKIPDGPTATWSMFASLRPGHEASWITTHPVGSSANARAVACSPAIVSPRQALPRQRRGRFVLPSVSALGLGVVLVADAGRAPVGLGIGLDHSR